ncbi:unnamed protein product [Paramecium octaurelia]|uniref:MORN repeat protein n=1 Tax=Paramecium octaurelia TaxID=43137 RepID=A0A8S1V1R2_PAROT|nr:unnamed protein product [Paramecium octaurelia]
MGNCCNGNQMLDRQNPQINLITDQQNSSLQVDRAAIKIQSYFRGIKVRKDMKSMKNQYHCNNEHAPLTLVAKLSRMPNYLTEKTKKVHDEQGPFEEMSEPDLPKLGPYEYNDQTVYYGQYKNGLKHGYGTQIWIDGSIYEGQWQKNSAQGIGRLIHCGGDVYIGEWQNDKANGYVIYYGQQGNLYSCRWRKICRLMGRRQIARRRH